jgi:outer membrane lipoprotein
MRIRPYRVLSLALFTLLVTGCAHVISKEIRDQVEPGLTFREVFQNPDAYKGKIVLWGGTIISTKHQKDGTLLEILQRPMDMRGEPEAGDQSGGRFLALYPEFLDDAIYGKEREVTVAGEIIGKRTMPLGEIEYTYPVILIKEIHLWPGLVRERLVPYAVPYPAPYGYYPYWYNPWWYGPAYGRRY